MDKAQRFAEFLFLAHEADGEVFLLDSVETEHAVKVLRFAEGDPIQATDGAGMIFSGVVSKIKKGTALCTVQECRTVPPPSVRIDAYIGIPEKNRFELLCEALPPLGVQKIIPFYGENSKKHWWSAGWKSAIRRYERLIRSSVKQSHNPYITEISAPVAFDSLRESTRAHEHYIASFDGERGSRLQTLHGQASSHCALIVGPPEGFSPREVEQLQIFRRASFLSLGKYRLRTEIAAVAAAELVSHIVS
ncbi:RsmE family RNA methyltransferase [Chitinivibrio alkaliphilus]|uniref:Ribosomal RNA small subunit methyltransferase E n=1 Tax=Chitinivibrio alkaliphilus ACht1 TaxID=1313304 RepID=U7D6D9_9BACT|nr:RsmE family RNA methyltransferase [Chitinivibrio alkaliphilus]ERP31503.1 16S ribosomal RNA methyltransferase RsmE [Chitinivibrio alkaliphilus ACht1]